DRKSTRLNSSHDQISYAVFCLKKKNQKNDLLAPLTNAPDKTMLRETILLADHNAYHLGQFIKLRKMLVDFFFKDTATTEIYTLSLHDALPISSTRRCPRSSIEQIRKNRSVMPPRGARSEEHTSELQSRSDIVCRLLLEKK